MAVRVTPSRRRAEEWELVLVSAGFAGRIAQSPDGWQIVVAAGDAELAAVVLDAFDRENAAPAQPPAEPPEWGRTLAGVVMGSGLVGAYIVTGPAALQGPWYRRGSASASAIMEGELWRTVTALTLHVDHVHLVGNTLALGVFGAAVCRILGPGVGASLILLGGAGGNLANAVLHRYGHSTVGASTAVFAAVGILSGLAAGRGWAWRRAWMALGAGLALLAVLGTGERADLGAHLFGFAAGAGLGAASVTAVPRPPGRAVQWTLAVSVAAVVAGCWAIAFR